MSLTQLESFVAVAEEQHVGRAARRLHVTQPPLTRRIRSLEHELGVELFARTTRGMQLLPAGQALLEDAREILASVDRMLEHALRERATIASCGDGVVRCWSHAASKSRAAATRRRAS